MPRRFHDFLMPEKPAPKRKSSNGLGKIGIEQGEILLDLIGKEWELGKALAAGGFGEIYQVIDFQSDSVDVTNSNYVVKIEPHSNGPLFAEVNCYLRIAKQEMIDDWKRKHNLDFLGMPHYIASGSHYYANQKYRFLILPKYKTDLEKILKEKRIFNIKTVLTVSIQILHVLEYIHSKGYVHCDIKASNIMIGERLVKRYKEVSKKSSQRRPLRSNFMRKCKVPTRSKRNLRPLQAITYVDDIPFLDDMLEEQFDYKCQISRTSEETDFDQLYLLDYGLASKYLLSNGHHREFSPDERRAHAGTMLFCSRDAHKGMISRRSDIESLGYNIIYWLTGQLPWSDDLEKPETIADKKNRGFRKLGDFLKYCFNNNCPSFVIDFFKHVETLEFQDCPDYDHCRKIFEEAMDWYGLTRDLILDFESEEDWQITKKKHKLSDENQQTNFTSLMKSPLRPSNIDFKRPKLRKKVKDMKVQDSMMNWSKILTDPETIIKQWRDKKNSDEEEEPFDLSLLDIKSMNPTDTMLDIYNKSTGKVKNRISRSPLPPNIDGYTSAMMKVYAKMVKSKRLEQKTRSRTVSHLGKNGKCRIGKRLESVVNYSMSSNKVVNKRYY